MPGPSGNSVRVLDNPFPPQPVYRCVGSAGSRTNNAKRERAVGNNRTLVTENEKETGRKASTIRDGRVTILIRVRVSREIRLGITNTTNGCSDTKKALLLSCHSPPASVGCMYAQC